MTNKKGFVPVAIILIVIGVLALGGGALYVKEKKKTEEIKKQAEKLAQNKNQQEQNQQTATTSDETKDWKTYRNEEYGFEFKYPTYLRIQEAEGTKRRTVIEIFNSKSKDYKLNSYITLDYSLNDLISFLKESIKERYREQWLIEWEEIYSEITLDSHPAIKMSYPLNIGSKNIQRTEYEIPDKKIVITFEEPSEINRVSKMDFNQILSTFKFIK